MTASGPRKYFFDTQIIMEVERGNIPEKEWDDVFSFIRRDGQYWISPLTLTELLWALSRGKPEFYGQHQRRFRVLYPHGEKRFFDFPKYELGRLLKSPLRRPAKLEDLFPLNAELVLWATSREQLLQGMTLPHSSATYRLRLDKLVGEITALQDRFLFAMENSPDRKLSLSIEEWAEKGLRAYGLPCDSISIQELTSGLSAAYEFEMWLLKKARNPNYDVTRHTSDLIDAQQLIYLFDPGVSFITKDNDHIGALRNSPQRNRVVSFDALLIQARNSSRATSLTTPGR